ncbi:MAG: hypothetical protein ACRDL5_18775, partial [Solirubrobacteraceae bacterium]
AGRPCRGVPPDGRPQRKSDMEHHTTTTIDILQTACPTRRIAVELPLATVEELDNLAAINHITRQELLGQIISAALLSDTPHLPAGEAPIERLAQHAYLTHRRSLELANGSVER